MTWGEIDLKKSMWTLGAQRTKNGRPHLVHLSAPSVAVIKRMPRVGIYVFSLTGNLPFNAFSKAKRQLDGLAHVTGWRLHDLRRTAVSGMARLGVAPHVADKILNHTAGAISGVAAVYQRHEFLSERSDALAKWGQHVTDIMTNAESVEFGRSQRGESQRVAL
jgi:integrase